MTRKKKFKTVDEYIDIQPPETNKTLLSLWAIIKKAFPDATELLNYDIPAYALVKRDKQVTMAGYKNFVGFYKSTGILERFSKELKGYTVGKASVQFPNDQPLPRCVYH